MKVQLGAFVAVLALTACPLQKSSTTTIGGPGGPSSGSSTTSDTVDGTAMVTVPDLTGKTRDEAIAAVRAAGFKSEAETQPLSCDGPEQAVGHVDCQEPEPGKVVQAYTMVRINVKEGSHLTGMFLREHFAALKGLTVEQATAKAKQLGHTGEIKVRPLDQYREGCKANTVCSATDERGGQSGMSDSDMLVLETNNSLSIAPPPD